MSRPRPDIDPSWLPIETAPKNLGIVEALGFDGVLGSSELLPCIYDMEWDAGFGRWRSIEPFRPTAEFWRPKQTSV